MQEFSGGAERGKLIYLFPSPQRAVKYQNSSSRERFNPLVAQVCSDLVRLSDEEQRRPIPEKMCLMPSHP